MPRPDRHGLLEEARAARDSLPSNAHADDIRERRERLDVLVRHLEDGVLSPVVLEAVATRARARFRT